MARDESDREDIFREAIALTERAEFRIPARDWLVTAGFRRNGALSVFVDQDPVYHFDPAGRLRRGYVDGLLYRSQGTTLAQLRRDRSGSQTLLLRTDLTTCQLQQFHDEMCETINQILQALISGQIALLQSVPAEFAAVPRLAAACTAIIRSEGPWLSDEIRARR